MKKMEIRVNNRTVFSFLQYKAQRFVWEPLRARGGGCGRTGTSVFPPLIDRVIIRVRTAISHRQPQEGLFL